MQIANQLSTFDAIVRRPRLARRTALRASRWHWPKALLRIREVVSAMALMSADRNQQGQPVEARCPFSAMLGVKPVVDVVDMPRLLTVTANFPLGCGPTAATMSRVQIEGQEVLEVRLDCANPDFAFSDLVLVPYSVELSYIPHVVGELPVRIVTTDGARVAESFIVTKAAKSRNGEFDVTGKWIDPASAGTALALGVETERAVVGTWRVEDHEGVAHRYSIEGVQWKQTDVEAEGMIFETTLGVESAPSPDLPQSANQPRSPLGLARIRFHGQNCARVFALGFGGNVLFTSNLVRSGG